MTRPSEHLSMLDQSSPAPELMVRMMDSMAVNWKTAARIDGGLAGLASSGIPTHESRRCIWHGREALPEFCPNAKFFRRCAAGYALDQFFVPHADA